MTHATQLIYLAFGAATYQREAVFSIVSALTQANRCKYTEPFVIRVLNDAPSFFDKLPAQTSAIDPSWAGPYRYPFRIKHMVLKSGVIGLVHSDRAVLERSITWMDELRPLPPELHTLEEPCLALAAHDRIELNARTDVIHHYWRRKAQLRAKVGAWLSKHNAASLSKEAMQDIPIISDRLPRPTQSCRSWQKLVTRWVPGERRQFIRELLQGCHTYPNEFDRRCTRGRTLIKALERLGRSLSLNALQAWLNNPRLKMLAGNRYPALHSHILARFTAY